MFIQTLCTFGLFAFSYYEAVDGILSLEDQNSSIISDIIEIIHFAPHNEPSIHGTNRSY